MARPTRRRLPDDAVIRDDQRRDRRDRGDSPIETLCELCAFCVGREILRAALDLARATATPW
jgi:hypothetical protein